MAASKTPKEFYEKYNGKVIDYDRAYNAQCVDGFKIFDAWAGIPVKATPNNWADGYWYSRNGLGFDKYFNYVTGSKNFRNGDWVIWAYGSKSHPKSHIAMYYNGYAFGENQGGNRGFRLVETNFSDALGALRWKGFTSMDDSVMYGIDISNWQPGIDLAKVKCDFVIVKATEGTDFIDKYCDGFFQKAKKLGKKLGFYHFARPEKNSAEAEADFFYKQTKGYFGQAIPVLDWESSSKSNVGWAKRWLDRIYSLTGIKPMIYMSESVVNAYDWSEVVKGDYGLWVAKYKDNSPDYNYDMSNAGSKPSVKWWSFYAMWQWTSSGRLDGFSGNLDCNIFYGNKAVWDKYAGASSVNGWKKENGKWYYYKAGKKVTGWQKLEWKRGINWFWFDSNGVMVTGWKKLKWNGGKNEDWFYFNENGAMETGLQELLWDGKRNWYYLDPVSGAMVTGSVVLKARFGSDGKLSGGSAK